MSRKPRFYLPGVPMHVVQRGRDKHGSNVQHVIVKNDMCTVITSSMIDFGDGTQWWWDGTYQEVRFTVTTVARPVRCRVSREAIADHFGNPEAAEACVDAPRSHFDEITTTVGVKINLRQFETDGSVLLRTADW